MLQNFTKKCLAISVLTTDFQLRNSGKASNQGGIITGNCRQRLNLFFLKSQCTAVE
jgi:hypothetical protein